MVVMPILTYTTAKMLNIPGISTMAGKQGI